MVKEVLKVSPETGGAYEAPKCEVMELQMEGVLCDSWNGDNDGHEGWGPNNAEFTNWKDANRR